MSEHATACSDEGGASDGPALTDRRNELIKSIAAKLPGANRKRIAWHVNTALIERGIEPLSEGSIYRIVHYGMNAPNLDKVKEPRPRTPRMSKRKRQDLERQQTSNTTRNNIRRANEINQYESMMNAPPGKLNNPLVRTAESIQHALVELSALDPKVAVTQIPIERCRQWTPEFAEWWSVFTMLCEQRRLAETPGVPPMAYPRRQKLDANPDVPTDEYQLSPTQASVLAWMRTHEPATQQVISAQCRLPDGSAYSALTKLCALGMVEVDTTHQPFVYSVPTQ